MRNESGLTPLQLAIQGGHLAAAAMLVDKGADVNARDADGNPLLHRLLLQGFRFRVEDRPPASWLTRKGLSGKAPDYLLEGIGFLLACGADVKATNAAGQTVLQLLTGEQSKRPIQFDNGSLALLKLLIGHGLDIDERDTNGNTALHRVGQDNDTNAIASLIAAGAAINSTNHEGRTPLHKFAEKILGWADDGVHLPFQFLLKLKPDVNAQDREGMTPLHVLACADTYDKGEATQALLEAGANPNLRDKHGRTPIHIFLQEETRFTDDSCVLLLAKAGADLSAGDEHGKTALHYLAALGPHGLRELFFAPHLAELIEKSKFDLEPRDKQGDTPLHIAGRSGTTEVFKFLAKQGADMDATNNAGETPRLLAARFDDGFSEFSYSSETDVIQAVRRGNMKSLTALAQADQKLLDQPGRTGETPLRAAVVARQTNVVEFLDQKGVQWDAVSTVIAGRVDRLRDILAKTPAAVTNTYWGRSLLHLAAAGGFTEIARMILAAGGDPNAVAPSGLSPLGEARRNKRLTVASFLQRMGATNNVFDAVYCADSALIETLLSREKALALSRNTQGVSLIELAAGLGNAEVLQVLLDNGARADFVNDDGRTPLHAAANYNAVDTAELLIRRHANADAADNFGFTPLHLAAVQGSAEVAALLLKHRAHPNTPMTLSYYLSSFFGSSLNGNTPLHFAALNAHTNVLAVLLKSGANINSTNAIGKTPLDLTEPGIGLMPDLAWLGGRGIPPTPDLLFVEPAARTNLYQTRFQRLPITAAFLKKNGAKYSSPDQHPNISE